MKLKTAYWQPPIPLRTFDWSAWDDERGQDSSPIGWGMTEGEAIEDLKEQLCETTT